MVDKNVLKPLQMHDSYFDTTPPFLRSRRCHSYYVDSDGRASPGRFDASSGATVANSGLNSPLTDMAKFVSFLAYTGRSGAAATKPVAVSRCVVLAALVVGGASRGVLVCMCVRVCTFGARCGTHVCACVSACVHACTCVYMCVHVFVHVYVFEITTVWCWHCTGLPRRLRHSAIADDFTRAVRHGAASRQSPGNVERGACGVPLRQQLR